MGIDLEAAATLSQRNGMMVAESCLRDESPMEA